MDACDVAGLLVLAIPLDIISHELVVGAWVIVASPGRSIVVATASTAPSPGSSASSPVASAPHTPIVLGGAALRDVAGFAIVVTVAGRAVGLALCLALLPCLGEALHGLAVSRVMHG
jgi:hypothetical protein